MAWRTSASAEVRRPAAAQRTETGCSQRSSGALGGKWSAGNDSIACRSEKPPSDGSGRDGVPAAPHFGDTLIALPSPSRRRARSPFFGPAWASSTAARRGARATRSPSSKRSMLPVPGICRSQGVAVALRREVDPSDAPQQDCEPTDLGAQADARTEVDVRDGLRRDGAAGLRRDVREAAVDAAAEIELDAGPVGVVAGHAQARVEATRRRASRAGSPGPTRRGAATAAATRARPARRGRTARRRGSPRCPRPT